MVVNVAQAYPLPLAKATGIRGPDVGGGASPSRCRSARSAARLMILPGRAAGLSRLRCPPAGAVGPPLKGVAQLRVAMHDDTMRSVAIRRAIVFLFVALHLGTGALATARFCCEHEAMLECCRKGGPNHVCPFKARLAQTGVNHHGAHGSHDTAALGDAQEAAHDSEGALPRTRFQASCGAGHDAGVPVLGFPGLPQARASLLMPLFETTWALQRPVSAIARTIPPPLPPPKA
jgi:hypothetical protein